MEVDEYVAQYIMRDRLAEAQKRAAFAAYRESSGSPPNAGGLWRHLIELAGSLIDRRGRRVSKSPSGATGLPASRSAR
jgi:hypothetical protein